MPSQTFLIRAHARTLHTHPVTFVCAQCHTTTTREIYPGKMPSYCLSCRPRKKKDSNLSPSKGMFQPTHFLIAANGSKTEVCLEKSFLPGWSWVRTALDWFSGSSIIQYHPERGIISHETPLEGYTLIPFQEEQKSQSVPLEKRTTRSEVFPIRGQASELGRSKNKAYSGRQMMKRLKCGDRLLRIKRSQPDFSEWSQQRDPDNIAWQYYQGQFVPLEATKPEPEPIKKEPEPQLSKSKSKTQTKQSKKTTQKLKKEPTQSVTTEVQPLSGRQMMKRLKCGDRLLRIKRALPDFKEWSRGRDPDGIAWNYQDGQYLPNIG